MKSLIHKWTKPRKEKSKSSAGGSESGSRQSSSESHQYGQNKLGNSNSARADGPGMEAKDFGKVWYMKSWPVMHPAQISRHLLACHALSAGLIALNSVNMMQFSDDSAFRASIGDMHRSQGNSSSTAGESSSLSHFSSSIEGKPSMDSVLRPQMVKQGTLQACWRCQACSFGVLV